VLDNLSVVLGTQERGIVLQVVGRRTSEAFSTVPREFDINPEFPSWGKFTLAAKLCTWSPNLAHLLTVISFLVLFHEKNSLLVTKTQGKYSLPSKFLRI
jgi:hypothetical protein